MKYRFTRYRFALPCQLVLVLCRVPVSSAATLDHTRIAPAWYQSRAVCALSLGALGISAAAWYWWPTKIAQEEALQQLYREARLLVPRDEQEYLNPASDTATKLFALLKDNLPKILGLTTLSSSDNIYRSYTYTPQAGPWGISRRSVFNPRDIDKRQLKYRVQEYKIHLMPFKQDIPEVLAIFLKGLLSNKDLREKIAEFKFNIMNPRPKGPAAPTIVIYPQPSKDNAQFVLDKIYELFKEYQGTGRKPRWNAKVTDLIWWSQGDSESKEMSDRREEYFVDGNNDGEGAEVFKDNITGTITDYWLRNPNPAMRKE